MRHRWMETGLDPFLSYPGPIQFAVVARSNRREECARRCIIANAVVAHWKETPNVHYSRSNSDYAQLNSWTPEWFSRRMIVRAVDDLAEAGLLNVKTTRPSPNAKQRSRFWATPDLLAQFQSKTLADLAEVARPAVEIRDRQDDAILDLRALPVAVRRRLRALEADVVAQNSATTLVRIELRPGSYPRTQHGFVVTGPRVINPTRSNARRIFRDDLDHGGRWYGPWWQNIPSAARKALLIDGQATAEVDFSACQLRLAHGVLGLPDPMRGQVDNRDCRIELYGIPDVERGAAKSSVLIMLNARDKAAAAKALAKQLIEDHSVPVGRTAHEEGRRIVDAVIGHFPELEPLWFSDLGLQLQRIDGDICADVQAVFRREKVVVLSVHDSFVIAKQHVERLRNVMAEAFASGMIAAQKLRRIRNA